MAIDFTEEERGQSNPLSTCKTHQLKYDPRVTWGCVLCRKGQKNRISGYLIFGAVAIIAASVFYVITTQQDNREGPRLAINTFSAQTDSAAVDKTDGVSIKGNDGRCRAALAAKVETCLRNLADDAEQLDKEMCLSSLEPLKTACPGYSDDLERNQPIYAVGPMPGYRDVLGKLEAVQNELAGCTGGKPFRFALRVETTPGATVDQLVSLFGLAQGERLCVYNVIDGLAYPPANDPYTVGMMVDSAVLALHPPATAKNSQKEEFRQYLKAQRSTVEAEQRIEQAKKMRAQLDENFKSGM